VKYVKIPHLSLFLNYVGWLIDQVEEVGGRREGRRGGGGGGKVKFSAFALKAH
jgi:hypothetical protein